MNDGIRNFVWTSPVIIPALPPNVRTIGIIKRPTSLELTVFFSREADKDDAEGRHAFDRKVYPAENDRLVQPDSENRRYAGKAQNDFNIRPREIFASRSNRKDANDNDQRQDLSAHSGPLEPSNGG